MNIAEIGEGILLASIPNGSEFPHQLEYKGKIFNRFLDRLFLPCHTDELTTAQIKIINHFREDFFKSDSQFALNISVKQRVGRALDAANLRSVLEIGCGCFPIVKYAPSIKRYLCVEIDDRAINLNLSEGTDCMNLSSIQSNMALTDFDAFVGLFVFQFNISDSLIRLLYDRTCSHGIGIVNLHGADIGLRKKRLDQFENCGFWTTSIPDIHPKLKKNEFILLSKKSEILNIEEAIGRIKEHLQTIIP